MKIPHSLSAEIHAVRDDPESFSLRIDPAAERGDRLAVSFLLCGHDLRAETATCVFYDSSDLELPPDLILPPELASVTLDSLASLKPRGTRLSELAGELRRRYVEVQWRKIEALGVERLRFELSAVDTGRAEGLVRVNPSDGGTMVIVEIPVEVEVPKEASGLPKDALPCLTYRLRVTYYLNASRDSLSRVERQLLPGKRSTSRAPALPSFSRPLPPFSINSMLIDYVPDIGDWLRYELFPPADLLEKRKGLFRSLMHGFERQLLDINEAALTAAFLFEVYCPPAGAARAGGGPNPGTNPNLSVPQGAAAAQAPQTVLAICRIDVSNAGRDVPPFVTAISPHYFVRGKPHVPLSRELTGMLRWDWRLTSDEQVEQFREQLVRVLPTAFTGV
ncbi:hypothetical protein DFJ74DRAFT_772494 [Hyaloraphidium curvatum]|nr:hypothetical protein DFJ74DRAFT_772494 [Hyaloraphidium curvatum]